MQAEHYWRARAEIIKLSNLTEKLDPHEFREFLIALAKRDQDAELIERSYALFHFFEYALDYNREAREKLEAVSHALLRKCKGCGKDANGTNAEGERRLEGRGHYCSNACKQKAYRLRYKSAPRSQAGNVTIPEIVTSDANAHIEQS